MTANQTIDGVPREQVLALCNVVEVADKLEKEAFAKGTVNVEFGTFRALRYALDHLSSVSKIELRALLDAPSEPKPTGLSQGWNLTRKHDGFVVGHQSVAYPPDAKAIERAERDGYVWVPFLVPAAQPQGEPVGYRDPSQRWATIKADNKAKIEADGHDLSCFSVPLYAEQPAPVVIEHYKNKVKHLKQLLRNVRATLHFSPEDVLAIDAALREDEE